MAVYAFESLQGLILSLLAFCSYYAHAFKFGLWARVPWKFTCRNSLKPRDEFLFFRGGVCFYFQQASGGTPAQVHRIRSLDLWVFLTIQVVYAFGLQNWTCYEISLQIFFLLSFIYAKQLLNYKKSLLEITWYWQVLSRKQPTSVVIYTFLELHFH